MKSSRRRLAIHPGSRRSSLKCPVAGRQRRRRLQRLVDVPRVARRFRRPPRVAEEHDAHDDARGDQTGDAAAPAFKATRCFAFRQPRFARDRRHDGDKAGAEDEHEAEEQRAERARHAPTSPAASWGQARRESLTAIAGDGDAHLPGARGHHPEVAREQLRVPGRSGGNVGHWRELCPWAREGQRHDLHLGDVVGRGQHFDLGDARHRVWRSHCHEQAIRSRLAVEEHVRASDVRRSAARNDCRRDKQNDRPEPSRLHRLTFCIARPA